jgi:alpha-L-fucosidase 2
MVVCPSVSPENAPAVHPNSSISDGTTMDNEILFGLFNKTIKAAQILNTDTNFIDSLRTMIHKMPPLQVGKYGQLQEWIEDWDNPKDTHRHVSHLFGVFPGNEISAYKTPKLLSAARTSLVFRGDVSTGWSMGWKVNLWARMLDGNHAFKLITDQLTLVDPASTSMDGSGGTYPNLFDACPPFQIDGNFGCTSGIAEMIMQSHDGAINIIPAIPDSWKSGSITGLRARGGFETSIYWENHLVKKVIIKSVLGGNCRIRVPNPLVLKSKGSISTAVGENVNPFYENPEIHEPVISTQAGLTEFELKKTYLYDIQTISGKTYIFERE